MVAEHLEAFIYSLGIWGPFFACFFILIESIVPILPLCVFITFNFFAFGNIIGFLISWLFTCLGCFLSYYLVSKTSSSWHKMYIKKIKFFDKFVLKFQALSLPSLTLLLAIPFTPAFLVNIAAGLSKHPFKKFAIAILISKIFLVYFWGYIGLGIIDSFTSPRVLIKILIMLLTAYLIANIAKYFLIDKQ